MAEWGGAPMCSCLNVINKVFVPHIAIYSTSMHSFGRYPGNNPTPGWISAIHILPSNLSHCLTIFASAAGNPRLMHELGVVHGPCDSHSPRSTSHWAVFILLGWFSK